MGDIIDAISKLSPFGDKDSFAAYVGAIRRYYEDVSQYVADKNVVCYMNFLNPNVYVIVLEALRLSRRYDDKKKKAEAIDDGVQSIFRLVLNINKTNYSLDSNVQTLVKMIDSIPVGSSDLVWKVKHEYARTINGMSKTFASNIESCTSKQKYLNDESAKCKRQLQAVRAVIATTLPRSIVARYESLQDALKFLCDYVNFGTSALTRDDLESSKRLYENLQKITQGNGTDVGVLNNYVAFIKRARDNVDKLGNVVQLPRFADVSLENVLEGYDSLVKFIVDVLHQHSDRLGGIANKNYKTDKLVNLKSTLINVGQYFSWLNEEILRLERENSTLRDDAGRECEENADAYLAQIEQERREKEDLASDFYEKYDQLRRENAVLVETLAKSNGEINELRAAVASLSERDEERRRIEMRLDSLREKGEEYERREEDYRREMEKLRAELTAATREKDRLEKFASELTETKKRLETARDDLLTQVNHLRQSVSQESAARQSALVQFEKHQDVVAQLREANASIERLKLEAEENHALQMQSLKTQAENAHAIQMHQVEEKYRNVIDGITGELAAAQEADRKYKKLVEVFHETVLDDTDEFISYLKLTERLYDAVFDNTTVDDRYPVVALVKRVRENLNIEHVVNFTREAKRCTRPIKNRNDLLNFIMSYWFYNRHFVNVAIAVAYDDDKITIDELRTQEFRHVVMDRPVDYDENDGESFSKTNVSFVDYFLRRSLQDYDTVEERSKNVLAKYIFDAYYVFVKKKRPFMDAINSSSLRLNVVHRLPS